MTNNVEHFFMSMGHLYVLFGEVSIQVLCSFFNWIICLAGVESYRFIIYFRNSTVVNVSLANMFSYMVGSLFILMMVSLAVQKLLI